MRSELWQEMQDMMYDTDLDISSRMKNVRRVTQALSAVSQLSLHHNRQEAAGHAQRRTEMRESRTDVRKWET